MGTNEAIDSIRIAQRALVDAIAALGAGPLPPSGLGIVVKPGDDLQAIVNSATPGSRLLLDPAMVWLPPLIIGTPNLTLMGPYKGNARMDAATPLPRLLGSVLIPATDVTLSDIEIQNPTKEQEILVLSGAHPVINRVRVLGSPTNGQHRGINANAIGAQIYRSYIDHIWADQDAQAIAAWNTPGPISIDDCFLSASGETVLFGGADPDSEANVPSNVTISGSTLTKRMDWMGKPGITVKCSLEFKNTKGAKVTGCIIENCWVQGQVGFLVQITPRNQQGTAPYSVVEDIEFSGNTFQNAPCVMNIYGTSTESEDGHGGIMQTAPVYCRRVQVLDSIVRNIDPLQFGGAQGSFKMFQLLARPTDITIQRTSSAGCQHLGSIFYIIDGKAVNFVCTDNKVPSSEYPMFWGEAGGFGASTEGNSVESNNVVVGQ